ncbi:ras association domain-containing protein 10-like [Sinocyclocheilus anshuiensis]|uniref:Ras association domain-containing protein 10-like n=1 Tax=Sinocyclocheilus anshuiensis TaxID=1608454 RepID=A0A671LYW3_9TELE|nr:PREDICTED: ras association domain-containing protein 10-like [Sinocyclocheilus anshuiensis]
MEQEESKISVWVCREEKLVSGLSRRTTCADVVKVLMEDQNFQKGAMLTGPPQSYCIVEKWRGFERILPNKTKILRLWSAWGDEQENVRFVLVRSDASLPNSGPRSAEARVVLSKESPCTTRATMQITPGKQRRIVRKAFRKLDKINQKREETSKDKPSADKMETLVHLIISQDHTIRQQIKRIKELDGEIERYESKVHFDRMKIHGVNYVQDTYLLDQGLDSDSSAHPDASFAQFEEYASRCDQVIQLQEELAEREALMEILTGEIQEELNHRWMRRLQEELSNKDAESSGEETALKVTSVPVVPDLLTDNEPQLEEERIKTQLDTSLYIGLRLNTDLETVKSDLDMSQELLDAKEKELRELLEKVHRLDELEEKQAEDSKDEGETEQMPSVDNVWVEQARGLSKTCTNDDDSDTGLSSMHSQDSDNTPVCESLV